VVLSSKEGNLLVDSIVLSLVELLLRGNIYLIWSVLSTAGAHACDIDIYVGIANGEPAAVKARFVGRCQLETCKGF